MNSFFLIFILSVLGIIETAYLIRQRKANEAPVCFLGGECRKVLESKYNRLSGINNDVLGLLFYVAVFIASVPFGFGENIRTSFPIFLPAVVSAGTLFSFILLFIQWRIIKSWCFWCVLSSITAIFMAIIIFSKII